MSRIEIAIITIGIVGDLCIIAWAHLRLKSMGYRGFKDVFNWLADYLNNRAEELKKNEHN